MKKLLRTSCLLLLPLLMAMECKKDLPPKFIKLPPATQTGKHTFGCKINGEIFSNFALPPYSSLTSSYNGSFQVSARYIGIGEVLIRLHNIDAPGTYFLSDSTGNYAIYYEDGKYPCYGRENPSYTGNVTITRLDIPKRIISGTFNFTITQPGCPDIEVTEGRFDVVYR